MEKDKSRGIKHLKDKRKYKGNTTKNPKHVPQKSQPNLGSNWDRYESENSDTNEDTLGTDDFAILASAPITKGKHFQSKSDKLLASETESTSLSGLFSLNLEKLEESLMTIPFYERLDIDNKYFLDNQIEYMKREADENLKKYNECNTCKEYSSSGSSEETDNELEEILNTQVEEKEEKTKKSPEKKNEDLEQWLDDFLNE